MLPLGCWGTGALSAVDPEMSNLGFIAQDVAMPVCLRSQKSMRRSAKEKVPTEIGTKKSEPKGMKRRQNSESNPRRQCEWSAAQSSLAHIA
jgi:hypothetical protein